MVLTSSPRQEEEVQNQLVGLRGLEALATGKAIEAEVSVKKTNKSTMDKILFWEQNRGQETNKSRSF